MIPGKEFHQAAFAFAEENEVFNEVEKLRRFAGTADHRV